MNEKISYQKLEDIIAQLGHRVTDPSAPRYSAVREQISVLAEKLAAKNQGPTKLLEALQACKASIFLPMAAERHHHATLRREKERVGRFLAGASPIIMRDKKTLLAAPVGELSPEELEIFCTRVLRKVLSQKPRKVVLYLDGLVKSNHTISILKDLESDLVQQNIKTETA